MHGPTCIFWANLTPFSLYREPAALELGGDNEERCGALYRGQAAAAASSEAAGGGPRMAAEAAEPARLHSAGCEGGGTETTKSAAGPLYSTLYRGQAAAGGVAETTKSAAGASYRGRGRRARAGRPPRPAAPAPRPRSAHCPGRSPSFLSVKRPAAPPCYSTKAPYKTDLLRETLRALNRPGGTGPEQQEAAGAVRRELGGAQPLVPRRLRLCRLGLRPRHRQ